MLPLYSPIEIGAIGGVFMKQSSRVAGCKNPATINDDEEVFTRKEASRYLAVSIGMLDSKLDIPFLKIGRSKRYLKSDLDTFLLSCRVGGSNE
jgi:hypothetical protein